jgi:imidazolonepropionase-like amidohydrolase
MQLANMLKRLITLIFITAITASPGVSATLAFIDISVVRPESARVDSHQTVLIDDGVITAVGPATDLPLPAGARVLASGEGFLSPGLAEMHAHVPHEPQSAQYVNDVLFLWVANGVTTIRGMNGEPSHLKLRDAIATGDILGPRLYTAGPPFIGKKVKTAEEAGKRVHEQQAAGYDFIKVHMGISREVYTGVATTARELEMPFAGHVASTVGLNTALESGQATIDHLDAYFPALVPNAEIVAATDYGFLGAPLTPYIDTKLIDIVATRTAAAGTWNVPTLSMADKFMGNLDTNTTSDALQYLPPRTVKGWKMAATGLQKQSAADGVQADRFLALRQQLVFALHAAGAGLLLGSDAPQILNVPGFSIHEELALLVQAGLTPAEAITTGTVNPAKFFDAENTFGRVAVGLEADLILTAANPLDEVGALKAPVGVMLRGRWLPAEEIRQELARIAERNRPLKD